MKIDDIEGEVVFKMIRYMYTGELENLKDHAKDLIYAAEKYEFVNLKNECLAYFSFNLNLNNVFETIALADRYNSQDLLENCIRFMKM